MCINCDNVINLRCQLCACIGCSEGNCCEECLQTDSFAIYQENAASTARGGADLNKEQSRVAVACMGLAGETGEVVDYLKKYVGHGHDIDKEHVKKELGDVLWYVSEIATALGLNLQEIAMMNAEKLRKRYPEGFTVERSRNRGE